MRYSLAEKRHFHFVWVYELCQNSYASLIVIVFYYASEIAKASSY